MTKDEAKKEAFFRDWKGVSANDALGFQDGWGKGWDAGYAATNQWTYLPELPNPHAPVLVTWIRDVIRFVEEATLTEDMHWRSERSDGYNDLIYLDQEGEVIAWRPLPEPAEIKRSDADVEG